MDSLYIFRSDTNTDTDASPQNISPPPENSHKIPPPQDDYSTL